MESQYHHPPSRFTPSSPTLHKTNIKTPHTPPYTPLTRRNDFSRSASPASSLRSIQPTETISPSKKGTLNLHPNPEEAQSTLLISELTDADALTLSDTDLIQPQELEEVETPPAANTPSFIPTSPSSPSSSSSDGEGSDTNTLTTHLSHLACAPNTTSSSSRTAEEAAFERARRAKHLRKRRTSRSFKRSHAESLESEGWGEGSEDPDAAADQDRVGSARRLRRRTRGPEGMEGVFGVGASSSSTGPVWKLSFGVGGDGAAGVKGFGNDNDHDDHDGDDYDDDAMDTN